MYSLHGTGGLAAFEPRPRAQKLMGCGVVAIGPLYPKRTVTSSPLRITPWLMR